MWICPACDRNSTTKQNFNRHINGNCKVAIAKIEKLNEEIELLKRHVNSIITISGQNNSNSYIADSTVTFNIYNFGDKNKEKMKEVLADIHEKCGGRLNVKDGVGYQASNGDISICNKLIREAFTSSPELRNVKCANGHTAKVREDGQWKRKPQDKVLQDMVGMTMKARQEFSDSHGGCAAINKHSQRVRDCAVQRRDRVRRGEAEKISLGHNTSYLDNDDKTYNRSLFDIKAVEAEAQCSLQDNAEFWKKKK